MRILVVSAMYPSAARPDYGVFVADGAAALRARGHEVDEAVLRSDRRGRVATPGKYAALLGRAVARARRRPDVVLGHYRVPTGAVAAAAAPVGTR